MRELALHILDLMENSVRAGAHTIWVTVAQDPSANALQIAIEDDGPGLKVTADQALDPFYTTKKGKRTGLGLSLLETTAQLAGGQLVLSRSPHGGLKVDATMQLRHIDRIPLGDLASTMMMMVCTNPETDVVCELRVAQRCEVVRATQVRQQLDADDQDDITVANRMAEALRAAIQQLGVEQ